MDSEVAERRPYRMVARAESTAATGDRILDAAVEVFWELPGKQVPLDEVARRAGVTVQTVIRRFGGRDALFATAAERETERVARQRDHAPVGDLHAPSRVLVDHYEELGDRVLRLLAEEERAPGCARSPTEAGPSPRLVRPRVRARPHGRVGAERVGASPSSSPSATSTRGSCCVATPASAAGRPSSP